MSWGPNPGFGRLEFLLRAFEVVCCQPERFLDILSATDNVRIVEVGVELVLVVESLEVRFKIILVVLTPFGISVSCKGITLVDSLRGRDGGEGVVRKLYPMGNWGVFRVPGVECARNGGVFL